MAMIVRIDERDSDWVIVADFAGKEYRHEIPAVSTIENLDEVIGGSNGAVVCFGDYILVAISRWDGVFSAVYGFVDPADPYIDSPIEIRFVDEDVYGDTGHALEAAIRWCRDYR